MDDRVINAYLCEVIQLIQMNLDARVGGDFRTQVHSKLRRLAQAAYSQGRGIGYESGFDAGMAVGLLIEREKQ